MVTCRFLKYTTSGGGVGLKAEKRLWGEGYWIVSGRLTLRKLQFTTALQSGGWVSETSRASTIDSQLLDGDCSHGWQILVT